MIAYDIRKMAESVASLERVRATRRHGMLDAKFQPSGHMRPGDALRKPWWVDIASPEEVACLSATVNVAIEPILDRMEANLLASLQAEWAALKPEISLLLRRHSSVGKYPPRRNRKREVSDPDSVENLPTAVCNALLNAGIGSIAARQGRSATRICCR